MGVPKARCYRKKKKKRRNQTPKKIRRKRSERVKSIIQSVGRKHARESKCKRQATPQCPPLIDRLIDKNDKGYFEGRKLWISNADVDDASRLNPVLEGGGS